MLVDLLEQLHPIDLTLLDLQSFTIHILRIGQVQMCREWKDLIEELAERNVQMIAGQLGVGYIKADPHALFFAELTDEVRVHKQVVEPLATEMPRERGHGLGNDLHLSSCVELLKALDQALSQGFAFALAQMVVFGKTSHIRHQQHWLRALEPALQVP